MNIFEQANSTKKQGGIGETRAIYEYSRLGYSVLSPITDNNPYDLVIEKDGKFQKVQVKTSSRLMGPNPIFIVDKRGGGSKSHQGKRVEQGEYDLLFTMYKDGRCWSIPFKEVEGKATVTVGKPYEEYILEQ